MYTLYVMIWILINKDITTLFFHTIHNHSNMAQNKWFGCNTNRVHIEHFTTITRTVNNPIIMVKYFNNTMLKYRDISNCIKSNQIICSVIPRRRIELIHAHSRFIEWFTTTLLHGMLISLSMAGCYYHFYPWWDVIIPIHGEMLWLLSIPKFYYYYPWRDIISIHGEMLLSLSMARCYYYYPWRDIIITIHGEMLLSLSMARCYYHYPWRDVNITIHGEMLSMARCYYSYPCRNVIHDEMLSMARCHNHYP